MPRIAVLETDTIVAISTPPGDGAVHIVRLAGKKARALACACFKMGTAPINSGVSRDGFQPRPARKSPILKPRFAHYGFLVDGKKTIDQVLMIYFKAPHTYTGDDVVEIFLHGNFVLANRVLKLFIARGARLAERGEFTRRAFMNGRLDLAQAEAVNELITAKTQVGCSVAFDQLQGKVSDSFLSLKRRLMELQAEIEAFVDFPDEDIEVYSSKKLQKALMQVRADVAALGKTYEHGAVLRNGIKTVIVGKPNVGKSSLLNALLKRDRALVSAIPGTTRDSLEELLDIDGILFRVIDTAGIRTSGDRLEKLSIERTEAQVAAGQLFIVVLDGSRSLTRDDRRVFDCVRGKNVIVVVNKSDLSAKITHADIDLMNGGSRGGLQTRPEQKIIGAVPIIDISTKTRAGIADLEKRLVRHVWHGAVQPDELMITSERHYDILTNVSASLDHAVAAFERRDSLEFLAFDIKEALSYLGEMLGEVYTDDILDIIFSKFCIGK